MGDGKIQVNCNIKARITMNQISFNRRIIKACRERIKEFEVERKILEAKGIKNLDQAIQYGELLVNLEEHSKEIEIARKNIRMLETEILGFTC